MKNTTNDKSLAIKVYKWLVKATLHIHTLNPVYNAYNCHHSVTVQGNDWIIGTTQNVLHATLNTIALPVGVYQPFSDGYVSPTIEGTVTPNMKEVIDWSFDNCHSEIVSVDPGLDQSELFVKLDNDSVVPVSVDQFKRAVSLSNHYVVSGNSEYKPLLIKHYSKDGKVIAFALVAPLNPFRPSAYPPNRKEKRKPKANPDRITVR